MVDITEGGVDRHFIPGVSRRSIRESRAFVGLSADQTDRLRLLCRIVYQSCQQDQCRKITPMYSIFFQLEVK